MAEEPEVVLEEDLEVELVVEEPEDLVEEPEVEEEEEEVDMEEVEVTVMKTIRHLIILI